MSLSLSRTRGPQEPGFKSGGLRHFEGLREWVYYGSKFDTVDQLKQAIVLARTATALH